MTDPAIEMNNLTKQFGEVTAIDGIDLTVEQGEIFGFLGPNGAGKSTTINVLLDFVKSTTGTASMLGLDVSTDREALHSRIGVVPENYGLYDRLSGRRHVKLAIELKNADDDPDELLDRVGLSTDDANRPAGEYSTGMSQRLALAMALVGSPELLILDEPTSGLDPNGARELRELIRDENERGATVFFSSHILEQIEAVADRVGIMHQGQLAAVDTIGGLRDMADGETRLLIATGNLEDPHIDAVEALNEVDKAGITDEGRLAVTCTKGAKMDVLLELDKHGVEVLDLTTEEASLEDLFVEYTRRSE